MKLLIVTQTVDSTDPVLGFFVRWLQEFAQHVEHVHVICLKEGQYTLPTNVSVHSLGKEKGVSRLGYVGNFYRNIWQLRHDYDAVFVHMNPEYVVLGGVFWRVLRKRVALWYTHKSVTLCLRIAALFAHTIFTASKESFRLSTKKVQVMGHGIDIDFFLEDKTVVRGDWALSVGRLMRSKRHDLAIRLAHKEGRGLRIAGAGPECVALEKLGHELGAHVQFLGALTQVQVRDEYRRAAYFIHTSETGSLDKVVLEALACGLPVHTNDLALKMLENADAAYVREHHSLQRLIPAILERIQAI
jgi:glycosyltransferase involved in cell wall biosynthesis